MKASYFLECLQLLRRYECRGSSFLRVGVCEPRSNKCRRACVKWVQEILWPYVTADVTSEWREKLVTTTVPVAGLCDTMGLEPLSHVQLLLSVIMSFVQTVSLLVSGAVQLLAHMSAV